MYAVTGRYHAVPTGPLWAMSDEVRRRLSAHLSRNFLRQHIGLSLVTAQLSIEAPYVQAW